MEMAKTQSGDRAYDRASERRAPDGSDCLAGVDGDRGKRHSERLRVRTATRMGFRGHPDSRTIKRSLVGADLSFLGQKLKETTDDQAPRRGCHGCGENERAG